MVVTGSMVEGEMEEERMMNAEPLVAIAAKMRTKPIGAS